MADDPEILTPQEAADFLRVPLLTVQRQTKAGRLPGRRLGREWRFSRAVLAAVDAQLIDANVVKQRVMEHNQSKTMKPESPDSVQPDLEIEPRFYTLDQRTGDMR